MIRNLIAVFIASLMVIGASAQELVLKKGLVIKKTKRIKKGSYTISATDKNNQPVIIIEGSNITVDFNKAVLKGSAEETRPDHFAGIAIHIRKGKNITLKNLTARGYKIALLAEGVEGLTIENCDFSYNYRQRTYEEQKPLKEAGAAALSEKESLLAYGAAISLSYCKRATIKNCRITSGQHALALYHCNEGQFYNNDLSFNSGIAISLFNSDHNKILFNKLNFNAGLPGTGVGPSQRKSAAIAVYGQSRFNNFYRNSATHCGEGFFIHSESTGNQVWSNDFSYARDCGVETYSGSFFIYDNRLFECQLGIRGTSCFHSVIANNKFRKNSTAISLEGGQHVQIEGNIFQGDTEAIRLSGQNYLIYLNSFNQNPLAYHFRMTDSIRIFDNRYSAVDRVFDLDSTVTNIDSLPVEIIDTAMGFPFVKDPIDPFRGNGKLAGRDRILITEWGPYDFGYPILWQTNPGDSSGLLELSVLGPKGTWKLVSASGIALTGEQTDSLPGKIRGSLIKDSMLPVRIILEYHGEAFDDAFGRRVPANRPYRFEFYKPL